ncbi:MarR family winged helix-turn-helix transcriptional regulator [Chenggangzhangella methanolivorans]|uniref:MarR family winged helix-turn-helix transcriptional regulator n=1 Tax=Chenggangzhangella methanolivorans TaxID=1437009 RepID=A0A9E6RE79_9HYPH|nr:MarR family winged helix-turn-helix transcriptional regulator [Chenggangzhangella methanolivorans]QZO01843.1 MarR family winged helix-turn-helix transcriptional regulator [Chenggangzhangella methanolivorans]
MKSPYAKTVGYELLHAARLHRARSAQLLQELGLFPGQEQVLTLLAAQESGRTMGDLAAELRVRPPTASKTVARLAAQGLVERRAVDGDGRVVRVELTEEGRRRAEAVEGVWGALEKEACDGVDGKDRKRIRKLLRKVGSNLGAQLGAAPGEDEPDDED